MLTTTPPKPLQQLRTEKQTGNVASAQNKCPTATVSRQFKSHATVSKEQS
jgi:hypothetical protein